MSASLAQVSFAELLRANEAETRKWQKWFDEQPAAVLDVPLSIALAKNVREFLLHIFAVELRYAERLAGLPITAYETLPTESVAELFGIGEKASVMYRNYLAKASDEDLASVVEFPTRTAGMIRASKRKIFSMPCCTASATGPSWRRRCARPDTLRIGRRNFCRVNGWMARSLPPPTS